MARQTTGDLSVCVRSTGSSSDRSDRTARLSEVQRPIHRPFFANTTAGPPTRGKRYVDETGSDPRVLPSNPGGSGASSTSSAPNKPTWSGPRAGGLRNVVLSPDGDSALGLVGPPRQPPVPPFSCYETSRSSHASKDPADLKRGTP